MFGKYFRNAMSSSSLKQQLSYRAVAGSDSDSDDSLAYTKESDRVQELQKLRRRIWVLLGLIFVATVSIAAVIGSHYLRSAGAKSPRSFVPSLKIHDVVFDLDTLFASRPSEESNAAWDSLIPDGHGYVLVPDAAKKYGLKPGISTDEGADRYSVALYHQIHCLGVIRILFYEMVDYGNQTLSLRKRQHHDHGSSSQGKHENDHHEHNVGGDPNQVQDPIPDHVEHCFDYLRQSIMCAGDMTIEHALEPPLGEKRETTDGWGVKHQCKDWNEIMNWTLEHKAKHDLKGILG